jgi:hypothetical protein
MSGDGNPLVPAKAGIQTIPSLPTSQGWIAAFAATSGDKHPLMPAKAPISPLIPAKAGIQTFSELPYEPGFPHSAGRRGVRL